MKSTAERLDLLLDDIKNSNKSSTYTYILLCLVSLFLIGIVLFYIKYGYFGRLLFYFAVLLGMVIFYRVNIVNALRELQNAGNYEALKGVDDNQYMKQKLNYLDVGIEVKRKRITIIRGIYVAVFPVFLLLASELYLGPIEGFANFFWKYILAFILGGIVWLFAFNNDIEQINGYEDDALIIARAMR